MSLEEEIYLEELEAFIGHVQDTDKLCPIPHYPLWWTGDLPADPVLAAHAMAEGEEYWFKELPKILKKYRADLYNKGLLGRLVSLDKLVCGEIFRG